MLLHPVLQSEPEQKEKASHLMGVAQPLQKLMRYLFCIFLFSVAQYVGTSWHLCYLVLHMKCIHLATVFNQHFFWLTFFVVQI